MENQTMKTAEDAAGKAERAALIEVANAAEFKERFAYLSEQAATGDLVVLAESVLFAPMVADDPEAARHMETARYLVQVPCVVVRLSRAEAVSEAELAGLARILSSALQDGKGITFRAPREYHVGDQFEPARVMFTRENRPEALLREHAPKNNFLPVSVVFIELATARAIAAHVRKDAPLDPGAAEADPYRGYRFGDLLTDSVSGLTGKVIARSETAEGAFCLRLQPRAFGSSIPRAVWFPVDRLGRYVPRDRDLGHRVSRNGAPSEASA